MVKKPKSLSIKRETATLPRNVTQSLDTRNNTYTSSSDSFSFLSGIAVPDWCYSKILRAERADLIAILVLSELLSLGDDNSDVVINNCYDYFQKKFHLKRQQIKSAATLLHSYGLVVRWFHQVVIDGASPKEEMDLKLDRAALDKLLAGESDNRH